MICIPLKRGSVLALVSTAPYICLTHGQYLIVVENEQNTLPMYPNSK